MISFSKQNCHNYARQLILDSEKDVANLPRNPGSQGSTAYVIESGNVYLCNALGEWSLLKGSLAGGNGGGSVGAGGTINNAPTFNYTYNYTNDCDCGHSSGCGSNSGCGDIIYEGGNLDGCTDAGAIHYTGKEDTIEALEERENPKVGDLAVIGEVEYLYDGEKWTVLGGDACDCDALTEAQITTICV